MVSSCEENEKKSKGVNDSSIAIRWNLLGKLYHPNKSSEFVRNKSAFSKTLKHYCPGKLFSLPSEGKKVLASFINRDNKECTT